MSSSDSDQSDNHRVQVITAHVHAVQTPRINTQEATLSFNTQRQSVNDINAEDNLSEINALDSTQNDHEIVGQQTPAAERMKRWRLRKKELQNKGQKKIAKTSSERNKEFRNRNKEPNPLAKTAAERNKEYRKRKKEQTTCSITTSTARTTKHRENSPAIQELMNCTQSEEQPRPKKQRNVLTYNTANENLIQTYNSINNINPDVNVDEGTSQDTVPFTIASHITEAQEEQLLTLDDHIDDILDFNIDTHDESIPIYTNYYKHAEAHNNFVKNFKKNTFGHSCAVCDRLWWANDLKTTSEEHKDILQVILPNYVEGVHVKVCSTCKTSLDKKKIPNLSTFNGFKYPIIPPHLPKLSLIEERLISPRIPFMQIKRLRHVHGQYGIHGQVINIPVDVNTMVHNLPRRLDDEHCFYVHIKKKLIHKSSYVHGLINKSTIKQWLTYLVTTPLYIHHNITIDNQFFNNIEEEIELVIDDLSEHIPNEDYLIANQQTLLWNEDKILHMAPGENQVPISILFDEYAEELSFPTIYGGQFRKYTEGTNITPFKQATSELRRTDRRGADPQHLLYLAAKILRLRVRDCISVAFKHIGSDRDITKEQIRSAEYINACIESNLAFLRCIPNSAWYWSDKKKDLFAMIRQKGAPTAFMTLSANETGWDDLIKLLYKLKNNGQELSDEQLSNLTYMDKSTLVNEDAVTCAIYFNKLVNSILHSLQSKKNSPFGKYRVNDYFKRIEFQHRGSPHAHILLWLDNVPENLLNNCVEVTQLIDELVSVSVSQASGKIKLQTHKHTFTCYKNMDVHSKLICRFGAPFMPSEETVTLFPMKESDDNFNEDDFKKYKNHYEQIRINLENFKYNDFQHFYNHNHIESRDYYINILRAGINRPKLFYKRTPAEVWINPFNAFVFHHLQSNMDFQVIQDEYACASYVVEYVNKSNRGISNLQRMIIKVMDENPEFDIVEITRKMSVDVLHAVEMSSQEAAWCLLREPMCKSSIATVYIPTIYPAERHRIRKTLKELENMDGDSTDIWKENWFDKYEKRPSDLENITLAQFVAKYYINSKGKYVQRKETKVIRYRNYDMASNFNDYRREMVLLHIPFRSEDNEILAENKFIQIYEENKDIILERRKEFESNLNIQQVLEYCQQLYRDDEDEELRNQANVMFIDDPYDRLLRDTESNVNADISNASLSKLGAIAKRRENIMETAQYHEFMRLANKEQQDLLLHIISRLQGTDKQSFQIFFTGPAGCGKTFVIKLIMDIYNRYTDTDGYCNAYITCASTGKAAVAIDGTTVHTALKITLSTFLPLSGEILQLYRSLFKYVKVLIIDEVSMISAELLSKIDSRLKQITGNHTTDFGGLDIILIGDLRQLPPVRATPIYKPIRTRMVGPVQWRSLKFYQLTQVMRQSNLLFSSTLTKIGNGDILQQHELELLESRFFTKADAQRLCPDAVRLFLRNTDVNSYNNFILQQATEKILSTAKDEFSGIEHNEQLANFRIKLHKMSIIDTGGLPYEITFVIGKYYIITTNIDVADGLANGAMGKLVYIQIEQGEVQRVWLEFHGAPKVGAKMRKKAARLATELKLGNRAVPIELRTSSITLTNNKKITVKRKHFPLIAACAMTIHKSQGGTFPEIVYEYEKTHSQQLLYVALSRVTSIEGLYIVTQHDDRSKFRFHHGRQQATSTLSLVQEFKRLSLNVLQTRADILTQFISNKKGISLYTLNCQSLSRHKLDILDTVSKKAGVLLLSETWMNDETSVEIPNFNCVVKFQRKNASAAAGVAIYKNSNDVINILLPNIDITLINSEEYNVRHGNVGDIFSAICKMENGFELVMVVIYISPNKSIEDIIFFINRVLWEYSEDGYRTLNQNLMDYVGTNNQQQLHTLPLILAGDFNVNFSDKKSEPLTKFLHDKFNLTMNNNPQETTTKHGTTIDAVFSRYINKIQSQTYVSFFSYHKPIISMIEIDE